MSPGATVESLRTLRGKVYSSYWERFSEFRGKSYKNQKEQMGDAVQLAKLALVWKELDSAIERVLEL